MKLENKVAIVTGGNKGIGRAISLRLADEGANVVVAARDMQATDKVVEEIREKGPNSLSIKVDVTRNDQVEEMVKKTIDEFNRIDILVNNAGIIFVSPLENISEKEWDQTMEVNVKGVFLCCRAVVEKMKKQRDGRIINISSILGKKGCPLYTHYCASKYAVSGLTMALAMELAPYNINVNAVCPTDTDTTMLRDEYVRLSEIMKINPQEIKKNRIETIPLKRLCTPEDVAKIIIFLASSDADYITGQALNVNGGEENH